MSWNYDPTLLTPPANANADQLSQTQLMGVRYLVGDTITTDQQVQDEEILFVLTQRTSIWGAAATVCRSLASKYSRLVDTVDKDLRTTFSAKANAYRRAALGYEQDAMVRGGALPYAGGISFNDKIMNESNTDRVPPQFTIDMDDNYLPVAPIGNEPTPSPDDGDDSSTDDNV
jgi:hypothetical protein